MKTATRETIVDLREVAPHARSAVALYTSYLLRPGQVMQIIDDHDPVDLQPELQAKPEKFGWLYTERGPDVWRVSVTRNAAPTSSAGASSLATPRATPAAPSHSESDAADVTSMG
jgi:uncharacterized protein (DUF2249 family)